MALGLAALILLVITLCRLRNRKVVYVYDKIAKIGQHSSNQENMNMGLNS